MTTECTPRCPWCRTAKHVRASGTTLRSFYCAGCRREFDDDADTDIGYGPPDRRLLRQEREIKRRGMRYKRGWK